MIGLLAACSADVEHPSQTSDATHAGPASAPTLSPTPESAASAPARLSDPTVSSTWLITESAIGPASLGMTHQEAAESVAAIFAPDFQCGQARFYDGLGPAAGITMVTGSVSMDETSTVEDLSISAFDLAGARVDSSPLTSEGIGLGSTEDDLRGAYPDADYVPAGADGSSARYVMATDVGQMAFAVSAAPAHVVSISLSIAGYDPGSCF